MCPGAVQPWDGGKSEIRIVDMPDKTREEFEQHLDKYSAPGGLPLKEQRYAHLKRQYTGRLKLRKCNAEMLADFTLNYIRRVWIYRVLQYNCQTFAADLYAFLTGLRDITVFGDLCKP